jgi:hypothetical protein
LRSVFYDDCPDIDDGRLSVFYEYLLDNIDAHCLIRLENNDNSFLILKMVYSIISKLSSMDNNAMLFIIKNHQNVIEFISDYTKMPYEDVKKGLEEGISMFQAVKKNFLQPEALNANNAVQ